MKRIIVAFAIAVHTAFSYGADPIILKLSHIHTPNSPLQVNVLQPWCETLEKESAGRMKCQIYPSLQLGGTPAQLVDQAKNGIADIVWAIPGSTPGRFPTIEAMELPFVMEDAASSGRAIWEFHKKYSEKEFEGYKVLAVHTDGGVALHTGSKSVQDLAGFKGLKVRASTRQMSKLVAALGAVPVAIPPAQVTESISKGVVDGAMTSWDLVLPMKIDEVTKFHLMPPAGKPRFAGTALVMLMSKQRYESLPADLRGIIDRNSGLPLVDKLSRVWDESIATGQKKVGESSAKVLQLAPAEYDAMRSAAAKVEEEWVQEMNGKGFDGKALVAAARSLASSQGKAAKK